MYDLRNITYFQFFSFANSVGSVPAARLLPSTALTE